MGIYSYAPDIDDKIDAICREMSFIIMTDHPELDITIIEDFLDQLLNFVKDNFQELGAKEYVFTLNFEDESTLNILSKDLIQTEQIAGNKHYTTNRNLSILETSRLENISNSEIAKISKTNKAVLILVHNGIDVTIYSNGVPIGERNLRHPTAAPVLNRKFTRRAEDYKISLIDFYKEKVRTNLTNHWHIPKKRILLGGKTEDIFQDALVEWLMDNLSAKKINFKVKKISTDETDIEIVKHGGDTFLLELKWLGQNQHSNYTISKLRDAIEQVENYLESDLEVLEATLVVYDGRKLEDFEKLAFIEGESGNWKEIKECESKCLSFRGKGLVFHLVSETASKRKSVS